MNVLATGVAEFSSLGLSWLVTRDFPLEATGDWQVIRTVADDNAQRR